MSPALAGIAVLLSFAAAWELVGTLDGRVAERLRPVVARLSGGHVRSLADAGRTLGVNERIRRAGLEGRLAAGGVLAAKAAGLGLGGAVALLAAPVVPARLAIPTAGLMVVAGFLAPDALLERAARRRRERLVAALPDALDLLAVGAAAGRSPATLLGEIATGTGGPLAAELAMTVAEIECGASLERAVATLRERAPGVEVGALAGALERSRRYGSPLAGQLHAQAGSLRRDAARRTDERAARAAPKIQLVVALVLVPSVLLALLAAIVAYSDALLAGF